MALYDDWSRNREYFQYKLRKWLEHLSGYRVSSCLPGRTCWIPSADIYETEKAYHIFVDLSGMDPSDIDVLVEGNSLRISGERRRPKVEACKAVHQLEVDFGGFDRVFHFPAKLERDGSQSIYRAGLLEIILPKGLDSRLVQVPIRHD